MKASLTLIIMATAVISFSGCATDFEKRVAEAESSRMMAADNGAEWIQTEGLIEQAKKEADRGNMERANSLLELAQFQAETAIKQAQHEADAWSSRVVQ